jgi:hypothetical protein
MKKYTLLLILLSIVITGSGSQLNNSKGFDQSPSFGSPTTQTKSFYMFDYEAIIRIKSEIKAGSTKYDEALKLLKKNADKHLATKIHTVVDKTGTPYSGDKHDYMSAAPYWWPNPKTNDGLPWIRKDGEKNKEWQKQFPDDEWAKEMPVQVYELALFYFYSGDERYATKAVQFLYDWLINPDKKMNPNVNFGQAVYGKDEIRDNVLLETRVWTKIPDATLLLKASPAYTSSIDAGVKKWFTEFINWILTSPSGSANVSEKNKNNPASVGYSQLVVFSAFTGQDDLAKKWINKTKNYLIPNQINLEGEQVNEIKRTRALHYSTRNIWALFIIAQTARYYDINDVWTAQADETKGSLKLAADFLSPFWVSPSAWPYKQIDEFNKEDSMEGLPLAYVGFKDPKYSDQIHKDWGSSFIEYLEYNYPW